MANCKKCDALIPSKIRIDNKIKRVTRTRQYCFECSPYDNKSGSKLNLRDSLDSNLIVNCSLCDREYIYDRKAGHTTTVCNSCMANRHRKDRKQKCIEYKGGCCQICQYNKCMSALDFHHIDPSRKDFGISGNHGIKWERIQRELDKCIMVCCRCHSEIHEGLIDITPYIETS